YIFFGLPFLCLDVKSSLQDLIALSLHLDYLVQGTDEGYHLNVAALASAMLAILFNVAVVLQITHTSTVTYTIVSALRGGDSELEESYMGLRSGRVVQVQMLICAYLFGESLTANWGIAEHMAFTLTKDNSQEFLVEPSSVPTWWMCRKAKRQVTDQATDSEITLPYSIDLGHGQAFDWRVYVANHRWHDELLGLDGIVRATASRNE
ncbi:hypothetical protein FOZ62_008660, partial [Perkinsus olseni]